MQIESGLARNFTYVDVDDENGKAFEGWRENDLHQYSTVSDDEFQDDVPSHKLFRSGL